MKTAVSITDDLFQRARQLADRRRVTAGEVLDAALEEYLERQASVTEAMDRALEKAGEEDLAFVNAATRHMLLQITGEEDDTPLAMRVGPSAGSQRDRPADPSRFEGAIARMINRTPEQLAEVRTEAMARYRPLRTPPHGKTLADVVSGQWPGNESDEEIQLALDELS